MSEDRILTSRDMLGLSPDAFVEKVWLARERTFDLPTGIDATKPAYAQVNAAEVRYKGNWQGRWIFVCECGGAEAVTPSDARVLCLSCYGQASGTLGKWRPVIFPDNRAEGEALLLERPGQYRNWLPGETVDDLKGQNAVIAAGIVGVA